MENLVSIDGGDGLPPEPDWSEIYEDCFDLKAASDHWGTVCRDLQSLSALSVANGHSIQRLVEFRVQYDRASRNIAEHGTILKAPRSRVPKYNPFWVIMRQASEEIRVLEAELGLAPTRRGKITPVKTTKRINRPSDAYLKSVSK